MPPGDAALESTRVRLADFILANVEPILLEWECFARGLAPGSEMSVLALRDHARDLLRVAARDMTTAQSALQQSEKSKGEGGGGTESDRLDSASAEHAIDRLGSGFNINEVVSEYRALRASVLGLWSKEVRSADAQDLEDLTRFNESIDQSLAEAVRSFTNRVEESRELFLATLGHDLRSPLHAIMLSSELLATCGQLDDDNVQTARQMTRSGAVMAGMITDLLDFTRARLGGGMPLSTGEVDLEHLCRQVVDECRLAYPDRPVHLKAAAGITGEWDAARLRQVISNLVGNAIVHGAGSPVEISLNGEGAEAVVIVANRGPAIPHDSLPTLFDPFVRASNASGKSAFTSGIGLGLYIVRQIVTAHGGTISVTSAEPEGTAFTVRLPRDRGVEPAAPVARRRGGAPPNSSGEARLRR